MFKQRRNCFVLCALVLFVGIRQVGAMTVGPVSVVPPTNSAQVPLYGKIEFNVPLTTASTKFYEAVPAQGGVDLSAVFTAPNATTTTIKGFYSGSAWLIRFAPTLTGEWQVAVSATDSSGTANAATVNFTCMASGNPGFAQINGKYIQFTNGTAFYAVGHNTGWQQDVEQPTSADMASQSENLLSFWLAAPWGLPTDSWWQRRVPIENSVGGIGNYDQNACAYIDRVVANAEAADVYLLPSIWAHDQLCDGTVPSGWPASWSNNAYKNICTATNFYQTTSAGADTAQWRLQKNYYRYILARWGYSRAIVGWVGVVEIDGTTGYVNNSTQATTWCGALRTYFATNDKYRLNTSSAYPLLISRVDQPSFDPGMNMRGTDSYTSKNSNVAVAVTLASEAATMRSAGKPGLFAEFGGDTLSGASQPTHLHNGIWAGTAAGDAMTPLLWCDAGNYPMLTSDMRTHLKILGQFVAGLEYTGNNSLISGTPAVPAGFKAWSQQLTNKGFVWIQNTTGSSVGGQTLTIASLTAGSYSVAWYDVWTTGSAPFATSQVTVSGTTLTVTVPTLARADIACRFFVNSGPPVISSASASPNLVNDATTLLSVTASDDGGETALTYTWSVVGIPPGPVSFGANGTNAAKNSLATLTTAGSYTFQVLAKDLGGLSATQTVGVTVDAVPSQGLSINPPSAVVGIGGSQQFSVSALDQFGHAAAAQVVWSVDGGGTISAAGLFTADGVGSGPFTITATTTSTPVLTATASIGVIDLPPNVAITSPAEGAAIAGGSSIAISANASDDGAVVGVAFYANGVLLGTATSAPYSINWTNVPAGTYALTASATDNAGHTTQSAAVNVLVNAAPTVSINAPANNSSFNSGAAVTLSADAADADGTVVKVEFFAGATLVGTATVAPYSVSWNNAAPGNYSVSAKATDNLGIATVSSAVSVRIDAPPAVSMTSPAGGAQFANGSTITLSAIATDDSSVASVAFYANGELLDTVTAAPYTLDWFPDTTGAFILTAVATDDAGQSAQSAPVSIAVNAAPIVSVTAPADLSIFLIGANVTLTADASDSDGTVAKVEFFAGATLIGTATVAPYSFVWSNPASGTYALTAKATDDLGAVTVSNAATVTINAPPTVSITSPAGGVLFATGSTIMIDGDASDDVSVASVAFYANGSLLGTATSAPFSQVWANVPSGSYNLTALATDNAGLTTLSSAVSIVVNSAPTVSLTAPANNSVFTKGTNVTLTADASDSDGTVAKVEFFAGATLVGTTTAAPYSVTWAKPANGTYSLTAKATDNRGVATTSSAVTAIINAPPTCSITSPANNANINRGTVVTIAAGAADSDGTIVSVAFIDNGITINTDKTSPYKYTYTPAKGTHALQVRATDNRGAVTTSATVTFTVK